MVEGQMIVLAGDAGVGKSLLSCIWAQALAAGRPVFGATTCDPMNVLYINEENSWHDFREYMRWARYGLPDISQDLLHQHLRVEQFSLTLGAARWYDTLRLIVEDHQPRFIIVDTATPACAIQDEDKNGEASLAIAHLRRAQRAAAPGCGMLILKHAKVRLKGEERTIRGAKAWKGASDGVIFHTKTAGHPRNDGLHGSYLWPDKSRAFGLKERIRISPRRVKSANDKPGISLVLSPDPE